MLSDEARYQAEEDARTLIEAERIKQSSARNRAARQAARKMAEEAEMVIRNARNVASISTRSASTAFAIKNAMTKLLVSRENAQIVPGNFRRG
jgi:hypothetical protein